MPLPFTYDDFLANPKLGHKILSDLYDAKTSALVGTVLVKASANNPDSAAYLACNGAAISRTTYAALFADIGTAFGIGDGSTTFNVPDFRDAFPVGAGLTYAVGASGGAATHALVLAELAAHTHTGGAHTHATNVKATSTESAGFGLGASSSFTDRVRIDGSGDTSASGGAVATSSTGSGTAFSTLPPYRAVYFFIHI